MQITNEVNTERNDPMKTQTKTVATQLHFDNSTDKTVILLTYPAMLTDQQVKQTLANANNHLYDTDQYGELGCSATTLLRYIEKTYHWSYRLIEPDITWSDIE